MSCSRTQDSDAGEAQTCGPSVSSQALYHCDPSVYKMDHPKFNVSNQTEESTGVKRVFIPLASSIIVWMVCCVERGQMLLIKLKITGSNPNLDLVNINAYTEFGKILYILSKDIEWK